MQYFLLLFLGLTVGCARTQDSSDKLPAEVANPVQGPGLGDPCVDRCDPLSHTVCRNRTCKCSDNHPVPIDGKTCARAVLLGNPCQHDEQCRYHDLHTTCHHFTANYTRCQCIKKYVVRVIEGVTIPKMCFPDLEFMKADFPTLLGLGLGMFMFSGLLCFVLKMFARARFVRPRRYADARINPPLTVSETYAAFALAANASTTSSPARDRHNSLRSLKSASSSRRPSYASLHHVPRSDGPSSTPDLLCPLRSSQSLSPLLSERGSRRPSQASTASSSGDLREARYHHYLYLKPNYSLTSDATTTTGTSDSSPRTPKSTEQLLAVYHSVPEHSVLEMGGVGTSHTTSTLGTSSDDVFQEEDEDEEEEEEEQKEDEEEAKARLIS